MKHYHYEFSAYSRKFPYKKDEAPKALVKSGKEFLMGSTTTVQVKATSEEEARIKAKSVIKRKGYRLMKTFECEASESAIDPQEIQVIQLEMQKKMLDIMKGNNG